MSVHMKFDAILINVMFVFKKIFKVFVVTGLYSFKGIVD